MVILNAAFDSLIQCVGLLTGSDRSKFTEGPVVAGVLPLAADWPYNTYIVALNWT